MMQKIKHSVLLGLPDDMLERDGKSIALIKLLQAKGLNRGVKRSVTEHSKSVSDIDAKLTQALGDRIAHLPEIDQQLVRRWSDPRWRLGNFWAARQGGLAERGRFAAIDYATAVNLLFLEQFDADWTSLSFDENILLESCTAWPEIRALLDKVMASTNTKHCLNVFMLWPRIVSELGRWSNLDDERRRAANHAVFALCSVSMNDWFARRAVELCPELAGVFELPTSRRCRKSQPKWRLPPKKLVKLGRRTGMPCWKGFLACRRACAVVQPDRRLPN